MLSELYAELHTHEMHASYKVNKVLVYGNHKERDEQVLAIQNTCL